jgi:cytochrome bd-type quinol oxidase subunit 2
LRAIWIAGLGGVIVGHILWLLGISLAIATSRVQFWVLILAAIVLLVSAVALWFGREKYRRKSQVWAAFLLCLPIAPVLLTLVVLGVTYL